MLCYCRESDNKMYYCEFLQFNVLEFLPYLDCLLFSYLFSFRAIVRTILYYRKYFMNAASPPRFETTVRGGLGETR